VPTYVLSLRDVWHWCGNCADYPRYPKRTQTERPKRGLCIECRAREQNGTCRDVTGARRSG
jgi:hypothetical protein